MMRASWSTLAVARGQAEAVAKVSGTISDPSGAAIAGAQVNRIEIPDALRKFIVETIPGFQFTSRGCV